MITEALREAHEDIALGLHHLRILRGEMTFDELRAWFAAHLVPADAPTE